MIVERVSLPKGGSIQVTVSGQGPAVLMLHGFMGSAASMDTLAEALEDTNTVYVVDVPGHGASDAPSDPERYRPQRLYEDLDMVIAMLALEAPGLVGYSLGARLGLGYALSRGGISRLALISVGIGLEDAEQRVERVALDEARAQAIECHGVEAFVDHWRALPLIASQARQGRQGWARDRARRMESSADGLTGVLRGFGQGAVDPFGDELATLDVPLLVVVGSDDGAYVAVAEQIRRSVEGAMIEVIPNAGHAPHVVAPAETTKVITRFFQGEPR